MVIKCNPCQEDVVHYQKIGRGAVKRLWIERIIESEMDLSSIPHNLCCPYCGHELGVLVHVRGGDCYKMHRGHFSSRIEN